MEKIYKTEKEGQIAFFDNYNVPWQENDGVLVENCDGIYNGVLFEFKLNINDLNKTLFQAIKASAWRKRSSNDSSGVIKQQNRLRI